MKFISTFAVYSFLDCMRFPQRLVKGYSQKGKYHRRRGEGCIKRHLGYRLHIQEIRGTGTDP